MDDIEYFDELKKCVNRNNIDEKFANCCVYNDLKGLEFLLSIENEVFSKYNSIYEQVLSFFGIENKINIHVSYNKILKDNDSNFKYACMIGNLELAKFLLSLEKTHGKIDIHTTDDSSFIISFINNHIEISKLLLSLEETHGKINIHAYNEYIFIKSCSAGNFEAIKFLFSLETTHGKINIHSLNEKAFLNACLSGNINIINFLFSLEKTHGKINIHIEDNIAFKSSNFEIKNILINRTNNLINYKFICRYLFCMNNSNITTTLIQIKENKIEENKEIINMELDDCLICCNPNKYFFDYECDNKHFICINCFYKHNKCYFCRNKDINCVKLYVNTKYN